MPVGIYVPVYQGFPDHRKTVRAAALLGADQFKVAMHIVVLWLWALTNADENGRVEGSTAAEIAMASRWTGSPGEWEEALVLVGYLERTPSGHVIHGWDETGGKVLRELKRERERSRERRDGKVERPTGRHSRRPPAAGGQAGGRSGGATAVGPVVGPVVRGVERREDVKDSSVGETDHLQGGFPTWFTDWWTLYVKLAGRGRNKSGTYALASKLLPLERINLCELTRQHDVRRQEWLRRQEAAGNRDPFVAPYPDPERYIKRRGWEDEYAVEADGAPPPELDATDRLIREQIAHQADPRWPVYEVEVISHKVPVGWDDWLRQRGAQ